VIAPIFFGMTAGYLLRKISVFTAEADRSLTRVVVVLLAPCLAFDTMVGNKVLANPANWILPPQWTRHFIFLGPVPFRWLCF